MLFYENNQIPENILSFNHNNYNEKIKTFCQDYLTPRIYYDNFECEVILPKILLIYKRDFNYNDFEVFKWVLFQLFWWFLKGDPAKETSRDEANSKYSGEI